MPRTPAPPTGRELLRIKLTPRDLRLLAAAGLLGQALLGGLERLAASLLGAEMLGRLIAAITAEQTVLPPVGLLSLFKDVRNQLLLGAVRAA
jgi:hypothetical protein